MGHANDGFSFIDSIAECDREEWTRLSDQTTSPLMDWGWLYALEESGSVAPDQGWIPQHLIYRRDGRLIAAAPLYVKTHSGGEFVFDYAWADVASQLDLEYYPKLIAMSPLTPAVGYRFLIDRDEDQREVTDDLLEVIDHFCRINKMHGFSILWPDPDFAELIDESRFTPWRHQHFRWENESFDTFDDYLGKFSKNQRRNIRRERASMGDQDIEVRAIVGDQLPEADYRTMFDYYLRTNDQFGMWAARFLNGEFFELLPSLYAERLLFSTAFESGVTRPVGMAMLLQKQGRVIGRYWGAERFVNNLHFNVCYYCPIEWTIEQHGAEFDPGMGSSHKVRRGFRAIATHSLHHFSDERMQTVMKMNIDRINRYESAHIDELNQRLPFANR